MKHVESITSKNNLCTSCGICEAVCPKRCISFNKAGGQFVPSVNENDCIDCGICLDVCPGYRVDYKELYNQKNEKFPEDIYVGNYRNCYIAHSKNKKIRYGGVSGGCVTSIVKELLERGIYDTAFLVDTYEYNEFISTKPFKKGDNLEKTTKSRYIPISHSNMVNHVLKNRNEKIIVIGTSCCIHGFLNVISKFKLERNNYLILGLFCDRTMNYNVYEYFNNYDKKEDSGLKNLIFRTKENDQWPGHVKLEYKNGKEKFLPAQERMLVKDYFEIERCMYCLDKLNQFADISIGDNYTGNNNPKEGSNSIIIRTTKGGEIWGLMQDVLDIIPSNIEDIYIGQKIDKKLINYEFSELQKKNSNIDIYGESIIQKSNEINKNFQKKMEDKLKKISMGRSYQNDKDTLYKQIKYLKVRRKLGKVKKGIKSVFRA